VTAAHPGILRPGRITDDGVTITISGWTLTLCAASCPCHRHPHTGALTIGNGHDGTLGLVSNWDCDCCVPWTADELTAVLRDAADLPEVVDCAALEATG
jgi:hypothetical protein